MPVPTFRTRTPLVRVGAARPAPGLADDVREGLAAEPKRLSCRFLYDEEGSRLFEQICTLPEYYPTRTEDAILRAHAEDMLEGFDAPPTLIELGSGSSTKTRRLVEAALRTHGEARYLPIDISSTILSEAARKLTRAYPTLDVTGYVGDYRSALLEIARRVRGPKLVVFLGSSLGNYERGEAIELLRLAHRAAGPDGRFLLGADLVKDRSVLEAAYNDARGVSARFNLNLLARINRELGAAFDLQRYRHRATYLETPARVEMRLASLGEQEVAIPGAGLVARFRDGETIHTESSHKYTPETLRGMAAEAGFREEHAWTDPRGWFRVQRWAPAPR